MTVNIFVQLLIVFTYLYLKRLEAGLFYHTIQNTSPRIKCASFETLVETFHGTSLQSLPEKSKEQVQSLSSIKYYSFSLSS
jgi:hypothetical protein